MSNVTLHTTAIGESYNNLVNDTIHRFTISVLVVFWQLLLRNGKIRVNFYFETSKHSVQTADDNRKVISKAF